LLVACGTSFIPALKAYCAQIQGQTHAHPL
jgi:hypothetical protein